MKILVEFDYIASIFATYNILVNPSWKSKMHQPEIYKNLKLSEDEKAEWKSMEDEKMGKIAQRLKFPGEIKAQTLDDILADSDLPTKIRNNIQNFEKQQYAQYFLKLKTEVMPIIEIRTRELKQNAINIYQTAKNITGIRLPLPELLDFRVIDGISPRSSGFPLDNNRGRRITHQYNNMFEKELFFNSATHEMVGHDIASEGRQFFPEIFGKKLDENLYPIEEGFVKVLTDKINSNVFESRKEYKGHNEENISYDISKKEWPNLKPGHFVEWYKDMLTQVAASEEYKRLFLSK